MKTAQREQNRGKVMKKEQFDKRMEDALIPVTEAILEDYRKERRIDNLDQIYKLPDKTAIIDICEKLLRVVFPGYYRDKAYKSYNVYHNMSLLIEDIAFNLNKQLLIILRRDDRTADMDDIARMETAQNLCISFLEKLPKVREYIETDIEATYDGDPAAYSTEEIIMAYPGLYAIAINRIAHELFEMGVPLIPRIMTEYAHGLTGIDIHPGATIGKYFFIDHGTGIVIGETTVIGEHVKIYQGVTLGALSTSGGQKLKSVRRHPTIEDNVTIYSGASILGGNTVIGENSVIGSNVFITKSVAPWTRISVKNQELSMKQKRPDGTVVDFEEFDECGQDDTWYYMI